MSPDAWALLGALVFTVTIAIGIAGLVYELRRSQR